MACVQETRWRGSGSRLFGAEMILGQRVTGQVGQQI